MSKNVLFSFISMKLNPKGIISKKQKTKAKGNKIKDFSNLGCIPNKMLQNFLTNYHLKKSI
jgi:hypothetical protein